MTKPKGYIQDFDNLKRHCDTRYSINNKEFKIGDLTDKQLEVSEMILNKKDKLSIAEEGQLEAVKYIQRYRSERAFEKLSEEANKRFVERALHRATRAAGGISLWEDRVYNGKEYEEIRSSSGKRFKTPRSSRNR